MGELDGRVVLITGAARGQGRAHAVRCASEGADIVALDIDRDLSSVPYSLATAEDLKETASQVEGLGRQIMSIRADVRSQEQLDDAVSRALTAFGHVDVCIANAGIWSVNSFWEIDEVQWGELIDVNLSGVWRTAKAVAPHFMQRRSGCIIMIASVNAFEGGKRSAHYAASKHGLLGLMRTVALELAPYGIRCNAICPGAVGTDMVTWQGAYDLYAGQSGGTHEDYVDATSRYHALAGAGPMTPEVIAEAALWLASDRASYVTGIALPVDGGHLVLPGVNPAAGAAVVHPAEVAAHAPDRAAVIMAASGAVITFQELEERSNQIAHLFRSVGIAAGDTVAIVLDNDPRFLEVVWAAQRSGLYYTAVNWHLTPEEAAYIIEDSGASMVVTSANLAGLAEALTPDRIPSPRHRMMLNGTRPHWQSLENAMASQPSFSPDDEREGDYMLYSSGTTGQPKGVRRPLTLAPMGMGPPAAVPLLQRMGMHGGDVYLSPAPLYHAAPLAWSMGSQRLGSTVVVMDHFDAAEALAVIDRYGVTHAQFVPTMFVRMLKLPATVRAGAGFTTLRAAVHAAAPCPIPVKRQMIEWWGPIVFEYYSSTEGAGATFIDSHEWLEHPGSVGRAIVGSVHILDDEGGELPARAVGTIWFEGGPPFEYHNDSAKTAAAINGNGWATLGDVGFVDEERYLYLTDRKSFTIISGGVNIYPQESENVLATHPQVMDVAVLGVPNEEYGEEVKAVVQPVDWGDAGPALEEELIGFCREHLAAYKCPRTIDFVKGLPRLDTGKLYKRVLRERYWNRRTSSPEQEIAGVAPTSDHLQLGHDSGVKGGGAR